jgi:uncharacterized membrane protein
MRLGLRDGAHAMLETMMRQVRLGETAAFLSLLNLSHAVGEAVSDRELRGLAVAEIGLSLTLFFAATLYTCWASATLFGDTGA